MDDDSMIGSREDDGAAVVPIADARVRLEPRAAPSRETAVVLWSPRLLFLSEPELMARLPLSCAVAVISLPHNGGALSAQCLGDARRW
jgi:hypothetical protein